MRLPAPRRPCPIVLFACAVLAGPLAGCGSSHSAGKGTDPARAVPATAPLYVGAILRPTGSLQANARAAGQALMHQPQPYARLLGLLQTPGSAALDFKRDLAPWLGAQGGAFVLGAGPSGQADLGALLTQLGPGILGGSAQPTFPFAPPAGATAPRGAFVLDTTNAGAARSFLNSQAARAGAHATSYRGMPYQATADGLAFGLIKSFAVIGTEAALHTVIDTTSGGAALAHSANYSSLLAAAPAEALAHAYLAGGAAAASSARGGASAGLLALLTGARPANVSLLPSASSLALDADTLSSASGSPPGLLTAQGEAPRAVGELPGDSYLALGFSSAPVALAGYAQALRSVAGTATGNTEAAAPGLSLKGLLAATLAPVTALSESSPEAKRAFQSWMGPGALFASGKGLIELRAGVAISSTNPALSRAAVSKLAAKLRASGVSVHPASIPGTDAAFSAVLMGLPLTLFVANGRDAKGETKFVIGLGEASVTAALNPSSTLSTSSSYSAAASVLGEGIQPALIVEVPTVLALLEAAGLNEDPTISSLVPTLRAFSNVAGGGRGPAHPPAIEPAGLGAGVERFRLVLGLRG